MLVLIGIRLQPKFYSKVLLSEAQGRRPSCSWGKSLFKEITLVFQDRTCSHKLYSNHATDLATNIQRYFQAKGEISSAHFVGYCLFLSVE